MVSSGAIPTLQGQSGASDSQPVSTFTDNSNASFEQCRVVLIVCRFSDHKCRHGNVYAARCNTMRKKTV